ncbi:MAG: 2-amino-4-hydroxy-6-hydroxymethyldihydropteridine diphosphokinase [Burkholderiales bacterium]
MIAAYIGIGSNLDEPRAQVERALKELTQVPRSRLAARSSLYRSAPVGYETQPDFVNAVARLDTELAPATLLQELQAIEHRHGRRRSFANAPRTLDLDLLLYGGECITSAKLVVPHPRMHERAFALVPLLEIAPNVEIPGRASAAVCAAALRDQQLERLA